MSSYFFVISSLDQPIYRVIQKKRRALFQKYGLPYSVLVNSDPTPRNATYPPLLEDEVMFPMPGYNPSMALKFLNAVKLFFRSYPQWDQVPDYIVRINATVYIHFSELLRYMRDTLPRERVLAGPVIRVRKKFVNGMVMIFSKDVLRAMIADPNMYDEKLLRDNDDVALSNMARPYCEFHDMMPHFVYGNTSQNSSSKGVYDLEKIQPVENKKWVFRIRHDASRRHADTLNWDHLLLYFDDIPTQSELFGESTDFSAPLHNHYSLWLWVVLCAVAIVLIIIILLVVFWRK